MRETVRTLVASPAPAFLVLAVVLFLLHEPWRDEAQPWLVARDAPNMLEELDSETHPPLWYLVAFPLAKLGLPYVSLRIVHLAIAFAALCVLVLHAPFSRRETWIYAFGYFALYEYTTITRNYAPLVLLLYVVAATWRTRFDKPVLHGALLLLMTQTLGHGVLLAGALSAAYGIEWLARERSRGPMPLAALALAALGALLAYASMAPAADVATWRTAWNTRGGVALLASIGYAILRALAPLPRVESFTWSAIWPQHPIIPIVAFALAVTAWALATTALRRQPRALWLWVGGSAMLLAIYHLKGTINSQARHHGLLFIWFVFCLWIARLDAQPVVAPGAVGQAPRPTRIGAAALAVALVIQAICVVPAVALDATREFSGGPGAARYLEENGYADERTFVGIYPSYLASAILVHLPPAKTEAWLMQIGEYGSYTRFTHHDAATLGRDLEEMLRELDAEAARVGAERVIVIVNYDLGQRDDLVLLDAHDGIAPGDDTYVYLRPRVSDGEGTPAAS